jgi:tetratricopeptide (TPR) repeat protein
MALSEIEKLERRYAENPQGLTFAPLAEVHRKNGDVSRALDLLRPGLTLHPDYIPASIVLGRCHLDLGDLPAAEAAFMHVLGLDGENVIALKALADITERVFRFDESERWLRTLLSIDRSNDDARDQLGRVELARRQAETTAAPAPAGSGPDAEAAAPAEEPAEPVESSVSAPSAADPALADLAPEMGPPPEAEPPREAAFAWTSDSPGAMSLDLEEPLDTETVTGSPPEGIQLEQPVLLEEEVAPLAGLVGRDDDPDHDLLAPAEGTEFAFETEEDIVLESSGGTEFQVANASEELLGSREPREPEPFAPASPKAESDASEMMPFGAGVEEREREPAGATSEAPASGPPVPAAEPQAPGLELVLTESMAELLVQQGHPGEALTIFRHLERRPDGGRFGARIAELERATTTVSPAYSITATHGQSVQDFLRAVLASRPPAMAPTASVRPDPARSADPGGAPTRPAHDSLSLSSVFGEESTPTPPAVPAAGPAAGAAAGVSYDDFFGAPAGAAPPRPPRASDPKSDDLDQFHAWLQNLKR